MHDFDIFSLLECKKCKVKSHGKRNNSNVKRKICTEKCKNTSIKDLSIVLIIMELSSLPFSVLHKAYKLYDEANKLFKAALLTRCYVIHFLSPYIESEVNHLRHFIKIPFIIKGMEFIPSHSIFNDKSVISSVPNYLNNSETPIICYKYGNPIRSTIFNFKKMVTNMNIESKSPNY